MKQLVALGLLFGMLQTPAWGLPSQFPASKVLASTSATRPKPFKGFVFPLLAPRISSGFGWRIHPIRRYSAQHQGIDLAAPSETIIRTIASGTVIFADRYAGLGNLVVVRHNSRLITRYGHCSKLKVRPGQRVSPGQIIALVGSTGSSTGPHLHLETILDGVAYNPEELLPGLATEGEG